MKIGTLHFITSVCLAATSFNASADDPLPLTLDETISMSRVNSVDAAAAFDELRTSYWEWRTFKADQLPEFSLKATLPSYFNQYSTYMNSEGEYSFVQNRALEMDVTLQITQNVRLTGAKVGLRTSLNFLRQFDGNGNRFMSIPMALTIDQPLFGVNSMKWDSKIEPVRYSEAKAAFLSTTEDVAISAVTLYFDLLMSRENLAIAEQNLANAEKLENVAREKRKMGSISENDLRQMQLNVLDAKSDLTDCRSSVKGAMFALRTFLDLGPETDIEPVVPGKIPAVEVNYDDALNRALTNNKFAKNLVRRQLEADYAVAKAKGDMREVSIYAQIGYTGASTDFADSYRNLHGNQVVQVGLSIPLVDWGKRRGKVKVAESNRKVQESELRKESQDFNQNLFLLVERFCNQQQQLDIAKKASELANMRYNSNVETYLVGKISTLDLNDSQTQKDQARRSYISALQKYWLYWYQLRSLTLYDFENKSDINADIEKLVRM